MAPIRFTHLTDLHLPIPAAPAPASLMNKRILGYLSWIANRRRRHVQAALERLTADALAQKCDMNVLTGDLVNIALPGEFAAAETWMSRTFDSSNAIFCPGNHDTYVAQAWTEGVGRIAPYMCGRRFDDPNPRPATDFDDFPYVRLIGEVAFVMANSAPPTAPGLASGKIGARQLDRLKRELSHAGKQGLCRVLALHHPVTDTMVPKRKALDDREALLGVVEEAGVELVIHGHTHRPSWETLETRAGPRPIAGGASASHLAGRGHYRPARYNLFSIERSSGDGQWRIDVAARELNPETGAIDTVEERCLLGPHPDKKAQS